MPDSIADPSWPLAAYYIGAPAVMVVLAVLLDRWLERRERRLSVRRRLAGR